MSLILGTTDPSNPTASTLVGVRVDASGRLQVGGASGEAVTIADGADVAEGAVADAVVAAGAAGSISAKLRRVTQGLEDLKTLIVLAAGTNAIGKLAANSGVDIGDVDVTSVPADPFGANADAAVAAGAAGSIQAKLRRATQGLEDLKTLIVLAAGSAIIGKVGIDQTTPGTTNAVAPINGQTGVAGGSGVVGTTTQRVVLATDVALPTGTNAIGKLAANSGVDIGDVDILSIAAGANIIGKVGIDQTTPGTTNAVAPISGQAGVAGGSGTVGATTQRVVLATDVALPAGTNAIGKLSANSGVDIGDVDVTSLPSVPAPSTATINDGFLAHTATTAAATLLTIAAGKTWVGTVTVNCSLSKAAAATGDGSVKALIATAGTNVTPAAGTIIQCEAKAGAGAVGGLSGTQGHQSVSMRVVVNAPVGNSVTLTLATTVANATEALATASAIGESLPAVA